MPKSSTTPSQKRLLQNAEHMGRLVVSFLLVTVLVFGVTFLLTPVPLDIERGSHLILVGAGMERLGRILWRIAKPLMDANRKTKNQ